MMKKMSNLCKIQYMIEVKMLLFSQTKIIEISEIIAKKIFKISL